MTPETIEENPEGGLPIRDLFAFAGVRRIIGDPYGKLMQDEVADRIQKMVNVLRETVGVMDSLDIMRSHPSLTSGERKMMTLAMREIREALDSGMPEWNAVCKAIHEANAKGMARGLAAQDSDTTTEIDG